MSGLLDLTMQMTVGGEVYPFVEDENANVTGEGHQDKQAFAEAVNRYDAECCGDSYDPEDGWAADDIVHLWVTYDEDGERMYPATEGTPDAVPITALWGQR